MSLSPVADPESRSCSARPSGHA